MTGCKMLKKLCGRMENVCLLAICVSNARSHSAIVFLAMVLPRLRRRSRPERATATETLLSEGNLQHKLYVRVGKGGSCCDAQELAAAAEADGATVSVARIGGDGKHPQNAFRDINRQARRELAIPWSLYNVKTILVGQDGFASKEGTLPILLPHELVALMYEADSSRFHELVGTAGASAWWRRVPLPDGHPMRAAVTQHPTQFIPCKWFADDGSLGKHRSLLAHHWSSLLTDGLSTADSRFPLFILANHQIIEDVTDVPLIKACIWSFKALETGKFPYVDEHGHGFTGTRAKQAGKPICGGFKFIVQFFTNDWAYNVKAFHLPWHMNKEEICHLCCAARDGVLTFAHYHPAATFPARDSALYVASREGRNSPLTDVTGFTLQMVWPELMHVGPLGVCLVAAGSVLHELCDFGRWGKHPAVTTWKEKLGLQLAYAYKKFKRFLRKNGKTCTQRKFTVGRLKMCNKTDKPELKAKASNCLAVCEWLHEECRVVAALTGTAYAQDRATMMWGLHTFFWVVRTSGRWLTSEQLQLLNDAKDAWLLVYHKLRFCAEERHTKLYALIPKSHMILHINEHAQSTTLNPKVLWAFQDEDCMRQWQGLGVSSHGNSISASVLTRWCIGFFARLRAPFIKRRRL